MVKGNTLLEKTEIQCSNKSKKARIYSNNELACVNNMILDTHFLKNTQKIDSNLRNL